MTQLLRLNRQVLHAAPFDAVRDRLPLGATEAFWNAVRGNLDLLTEARHWWDVVAGDISPPPMADDAAYVGQALALLPEEPWTSETWSSWTKAVKAATGKMGKGLFMPLRLALTGETHGPELAALLPLIGRARVVHRLRLAAL
jgi:glutamyl-tRNA synthetase